MLARIDELARNSADAALSTQVELIREDVSDLIRKEIKLRTIPKGSSGFFKVNILKQNPECAPVFASKLGDAGADRRVGNSAEAALSTLVELSRPL